MLMMETMMGVIDGGHEVWRGEAAVEMQPEGAVMVEEGRTLGLGFRRGSGDEQCGGGQS